jgi:hypothetical protein
MAVRVDIDEAELDDMLHSPDGLVGHYIQGLGIQAAAIARAMAPRKDLKNMSWSPAKSTSYPSIEFPGLTLVSSINAAFGYNKAGNMYGGVNVNYGPTLFLTKPAKQIHHEYAFMTEALYGVAL